MPAYRNIPIIAVTESAVKEAEKLGLTLDDIACLLDESYDCAKSKRKSGIEERCVRTDGKIMKIVVELRVSKSGFEYWRVRQIGLVR